jgi:hypothetical protein
MFRDFNTLLDRPSMSIFSVFPLSSIHRAASLLPTISDLLDFEPQPLTGVVVRHGRTLSCRIRGRDSGNTQSVRGIRATCAGR